MNDQQKKEFGLQLKKWMDETRISENTVAQVVGCTTRRVKSMVYGICEDEEVIALTRKLMAQVKVTRK